jgi:hypothetical protein
MAQRRRWSVEVGVVDRQRRARRVGQRPCGALDEGDDDENKGRVWLVARFRLTQIMRSTCYTASQVKSNRRSTLAGLIDTWCSRRACRLQRFRRLRWSARHCKAEPHVGSPPCSTNHRSMLNSVVGAYHRSRAGLDSPIVVGLTAGSRYDIPIASQSQTDPRPRQVVALAPGPLHVSIDQHRHGL